MINNNAASEISDPVAARARFCGRVRRRRSNTRADLWYYHVTEAAVANLGTWSQVGERERDGQEGEGKGGRERSWRGVGEDQDQQKGSPLCPLSILLVLHATGPCLKAVTA
jgi:hypothetical protein